MPSKKIRATSTPTPEGVRTCVAILKILRPRFEALAQQAYIEHSEIESLTNRFKDTVIEMYGQNTQASERYENWLSYSFYSYNTSDPESVFMQKVQTAYREGMQNTITEIDSLVDYLQIRLTHSQGASNNKETENQMQSKGSKIFIGHGRSDAWKDLRDLIKDRLKLEFDEFNRVSPAGIATSARLKAMLDDSTFAFIIMTAEDETPDKKLQARMNVVHEIVLFQGRLGFDRAIVLLEEGCEEFSNIIGLGQIRFQKGALLAKSEEIRLVLERENLI